MSYLTGAIEGLIYIAGVAALTPIAILLLAIIACNLFDWGQALWGKVKRVVDPTFGWWL